MTFARKQFFVEESFIKLAFYIAKEGVSRYSVVNIQAKVRRLLVSNSFHSDLYLLLRFASTYLHGKIFLTALLIFLFKKTISELFHVILGTV